MKIAEAQKIASLVAQAQDRSCSMAKQMPELTLKFTPSLCGGSLHDAESLQGRMIKWIRGYKTRRSLSKRVRKAFWVAINQLPKSASSPLSTERRIQLYQALRDEFETGEAVEEQHPYQDELEAANKKEERENLDRITKHTLLKPTENQTHPCSEETFSEVMGLAPRTERYLNHLEEFLIRKVHSDDCGILGVLGDGREDREHEIKEKKSLIKARMQQIRKAIAEDQEIASEYLHDEKSAEDKKRQELRAKHSAQLHGKAHQLSASESMIVAGSYGRQVRSIDDLFSIYHKLPKLFQDNAPDLFKKIIENKEWLDPEQLTDKIVENMAMSIREELKALSHEMDSKALGKINTLLGSLSFLFANNTRELPSVLKRCLPEAQQQQLQQMIGAGLLENVARVTSHAPSHEVMDVLKFILEVLSNETTDCRPLMFGFLILANTLPGGESSSALHWASNNLYRFVNPATRVEACLELEKRLKHLIKQPVRDFMQSIVHQINAYMQQLNSIIPGQLIRMSPMDDLIPAGPFWVELVKQEDGKFTLLVYGDSHGLFHHKRDQSERVAWPMKIVDIDPDAVDPDFFETLLYHHFEPGFDNSVSSTVDALYKALESVGGMEVSSEYRPMDTPSTSKESIIESMMIEKETPLTLYRMKFDALTTFCNSHMKDDVLTFADQEISDSVLTAVLQLEHEMQSLKSELSVEQVQKIDATLQDIKMRLLVFDYNQPLSEDPTLLGKPVAKILSSMGINSHNFRKYGDVLHLILGDDVMEVVELCIDSGDTVLTSKKEVKVAEPSNMSMIRRIVRNAYFKTVFQAVQYGYIIARLSASPFYLTYLLMPAVMPHLPERIRHSVGMITATATQMATYLCVNLILAVLNRLDDKKVIQQSRESLNDWAKKILREPEVRFDVKDPVQIESPIEIVLDEDATLFSLNHEEKSDVCIPAPFKPFDSSGITASNVADILWSRIEGVEEMYRAEQIIHMLQTIRALPIPRGKSDFWSEVSEIKRCFASLNWLSVHFVNLSKDIEGIEYSEIVMAQFHLLAISETLVKRIPEAKLEGYYVNASSYKFWRDSNGCIITDVDTLAYLDELDHYYSSITYNSTPEGLFHIAYQNKMQSSSRITEAEESYLLKLYDEPGAEQRVSKILEASKIKDKNPYKDVTWEQCHKDRDVILDVLNEMTAVLEESQTIVPYEFRLLKHQALICNALVLGEEHKPSNLYKAMAARWRPQSDLFLGINMAEWRNSVKRYASHYIPLVKPTYEDETPPLRVKMACGTPTLREPLHVFFESDDPNTLLTGNQYVRVFHRLKVFSDQIYQSKISKRTENQHLKQSEMMIGLKWRVQKYFESDFRKDPRGYGKLIYTEYADRIPRTVAYYLHYMSERGINFVHFDHLVSEIFRGGHLRRQLKDSPQFALALGELVSKILTLFQAEIYINDEYKRRIFAFAITLFKYCKHYAPNHLHAFPDLYKIIGESNIDTKHSLQVLVFDGPLKELVHHLCVGRFEPAFSKEFFARFLEWLPTIRAWLQDQDFALNLAKKILKSRGFLYENVPIKGINGCQITFGNAAIICILQGKITGFSKDPQRGKVECRHLIGTSEHLCRTLFVHQGRFSITRRYSEKEYFAVVPDAAKKSQLMAALKHNGLAVTDKTLFWIEETESDEPTVLMEKTRSHDIARTAKIKRQKNNTFVVTMPQKEEALVEVDDKSGLASLSRFCSLDEIACFRKKSQSTMHSFKFKRFGLSFSVRGSRAYGTEKFPDFFIAPHQDHSKVKPYGSYLLLENKNGKHKVLLHADQQVAAALWHPLKHIQPISHLLPTPLDFLGSPKSFFAYDLDEQGDLISEDPKALVYLMQVNIVHFNWKALQKTCTQFIDLSKKKRISQELWKQMILITLAPSMTANLTFLRMQLIASLEENRLIQYADKGAQITEEKSPLTAVLYIQAMMRDLDTLLSLPKMERRRQGLGAISMDKEWFLYKSLFRQSRQLLLDSERVPARIRQYIEKPDLFEGLMQAFILPAKLSERYAQIKKKYGFAESVFLKVVRAAVRFRGAGSPTGIPSTNPLELAKFVCRDLFPGQMQYLGHLTDGVVRYLEIEKEIISVLRMNAGFFFYQESYITELRSALLESKKTAEKPPSLSVASIDGGVILEHFLYFYSVAKGERSSEEYQQLRKLLPRLHRRFDAFPNHLVGMLEFVSSWGVLFPSSEKLMKAVKQPKLLPDVNYQQTSGIDFVDIRAGSKFFEEEPPALIRVNFYYHYPFLYNLAYHKPNEFKIKYESTITSFTGDDLCMIAFAQRLSDVANNPGDYLAPQQFNKRLINNFMEEEDFYDDAHQYEPWHQLWKSVEMRYRGGRSVQIGLKFAISGVAASLLELAGYRATGKAAQAIVGSGRGAKVLELASHSVSPAVRSYQALSHGIAESKAIEVSDPKSLKHLVSTPYAGLDSEDAVIDGFLSSLFDEVFERNSSENSGEAEFKPLDLDRARSEPEEERLQKTNKSISDYYEIDTGRVTYALKNSDNLWGLYTRLSATIEEMKATHRHDEQSLLGVVNPKRSRHKRDPLTFDHLVDFALSGDLSLIGDDISMDQTALQRLDFLVIRQLARGTRVKQLKRIRSMIESLSKIDREQDRAAYYRKMEQIAEQLETQRAYHFSEVKSPRLLLRMLCFEYFSNMLIWPKQFERISKACLECRGNTVLELLMSLGKTVCINPLIANEEANGEQIVFVIWPSAMAETNTRQIGRQHRDLFKRVVNTLRFTRDHALGIAQLQALKVLFLRAKDNGEIINTTREDLQALELTLIELLYNLESDESKIIKDVDEVLLLLKDLLYLIRFKSRFVGDEGHELFDRSQETNYPLGRPVIINRRYYKVMEKCKKFLLQEKEILSAIKENRKPVLSLEAKKRVARRFNKRQDFVDYVTGQSKTIPEWIRKSKRYKEISLIKGTLTTLLPHIFNTDHLVDQGPSKTRKGEFAVPYDGNKSEMVNALIRSPYETLAKTFVQHLHAGLSQQQTRSALIKLLFLVEQEAKTNGIEKRETQSYKFFARACPDEEVDLFDRKTWGKGHHYLEHNTDFICFYVEHFVYKNIEYWRYNNCSNTQNFGSMSQSQFYDTGTPYNDGTYPPDLSVLWDKGTTGRALHIASNKCPGDGVKVLENETPKEILDEVMKKYFYGGSDFTALIDGSAVLKGLSNGEVAEAMMDYVQVHRKKDIQGIVFFKKDQDNRDQLVCWEVGAPEPILLDRSNVPSEKRLTYFDQRHGFAADVPQKPNGKAVNLVGPRITLYRWLQEIFRMRGVKLWQKLTKATGDDLSDLRHQTQEVHHAMTKEAARMISGDRAPTFRDIAHFATKNEATIAYDNYLAMREKIANVGRRFALDKIISSFNVKHMREWFSRYSGLLITKIEDDPSLLFGMIATPKNTEQAIEAYVANFLRGFRDDDRQEIAESVAAIPKQVMPETVTVFTDGENQRDDAGSELGKTVTVNVSTQQAEQQNQDQDQDQQMQQQQNQHQYSTTQPIQTKVHPYKEFEWKKKYSPYDKKWCTFSTFAENYKQSRASKPCLWELGYLIAKSDLPKQLASIFSPRIWFSNNFLPVRNDDGTISLPPSVGSKSQRELVHLLVLADRTDDGMEIRSVGCLSVADAQYWRDQISSTPRFKDQYAFIYDVPLEVVTWGGADLDLQSLRADPEFACIVAQLKVLNGDFDGFTVGETKALRDWIHVDNADDLRVAVRYIHKERGGYVPMTNSTLDFILSKYENHFDFEEELL